MKKTTIALLTVTAAASMAGIAHAVPFGPNNNVPPGLNREDGLSPGLLSQSGFPPGLLNRQNELPSGLNTQGGNNPLITLTPHTNTPVSTVPEGGTSLVFLGIGLVALTLWHRRWRESSTWI